MRTRSVSWFVSHLPKAKTPQWPSLQMLLLLLLARPSLRRSGAVRRELLTPRCLAALRNTYVPHLYRYTSKCRHLTCYYSGYYAMRTERPVVTTTTVLDTSRRRGKPGIERDSREGLAGTGREGSTRGERSRSGTDPMSTTSLAGRGDEEEQTDVDAAKLNINCSEEEHKTRLNIFLIFYLVVPFCTKI